MVVIERARCPFKNSPFVLPRNVISLTVLPWNEEDELKWDQRKKREKLISALKTRAIIITKEEEEKEEKEKMVE